MSGIRQFKHPWLSDHVLFFTYRWLGWLVAVAIGLAQQTLFGDLRWLFVFSGLLAIISTIGAQSYTRVVRRNPALLAADMALAALLLVSSEGWLGPFGLYATSALVLPALIFGWRGGLMAGLSFVTLTLAGYWANDRPPEDLWTNAALTTLLPTMLVPPLSGVVFPWGVERVRLLLSRRQQTRQRGAPSANLQPGRELPPNTYSRPPQTSRNAPPTRKLLDDQEPMVAPATTVRAAEQSVEDLRRVIFAPLPAPDMELPAVLDLLAVRFHQHTSTLTRVTLLGRTRTLHRAQHGVLVRLTQEALLNVQQHAHAATVNLTLRYDITSVALLIQDNGVGLLDGTYERPGLHALRAMQYRLNELGGRLDVFDTEGGGLSVRAMMPIEP